MTSHLDRLPSRHGGVKPIEFSVNVRQAERAETTERRAGLVHGWWGRYSTRPAMACGRCLTCSLIGCRAWPTLRSGRRHVKAHSGPLGDLRAPTRPTAGLRSGMRSTGSATDLLRAEVELAADGFSRHRPGWPNNPRAFAGRLRRSQTGLRTLGIEIAFSREGRAGRRIIQMTLLRKLRQQRQHVRTK
jgi:hypothetical protein